MFITGESSTGKELAAEALHRLGGSIGLTSTVGQGTTFRFDILLDAAAAPGMAARRLRILPAEDNGTNRLVAMTRLKMMGHRVDAVASGQEAIDALRSVPYDLVLMDVVMPEMDGLTATRAIRTLPGPAADIPIVAITANVFQQHREECMAAGMDAFLGKPIIPQHLANVLDSAMAGTLRPRPGADGPDAEGFRQLVRDVGPEIAAALFVTFATEATTRLAMMQQPTQGDWDGLGREAQAPEAAAAALGRLTEALERVRSDLERAGV